MTDPQPTPSGALRGRDRIARGTSWDVSCESCGRRAATTRVTLNGAEPFAVCPDCAPCRRASAAEQAGAVRSDARTWSPSEPDDVPPLDWAGELRIRQPWAEIARVVGGVLAPGLLALLAFHLGGRSNDAFLAMVAVGVLAAAFSIWLDRRR